VLAIVLLGPGPAVAIATFGTVLDTVKHKVGLELAAQNLVACATFPLLTAVAFDAVVSEFQLAPDDPLFALLVIPTAHVADALSFLTNAVQWRLAFGRSIRQELRDIFWPVLPITTVAAPLIGAVAYGYGQIGVGAVIAALPFELLIDYLLRQLERSRARAREIERLAENRRHLVTQTLDAEDRARRNLAQALHDRTIQDLLAARQEVEAVEAGDQDALRRLDRAVASAIDELRRTSFELHPAVLRHAGLAAALTAIAEQHAEKAGFEIRTDLSSDLDGCDEQLLFSIARELITNAAKHADASEVWVSVSRYDGRVDLEVRDNGRGFQTQSRTESVLQGHIGLASVAERVEAAGGSVTLRSSRGEGTTVRIALPARVVER
jgi:two-component system NarL family sensor kinase